MTGAKPDVVIDVTTEGDTSTTSTLISRCSCMSEAVRTQLLGLKNTAQASMVVGLFLVHPNIMEQTFTIMSCTVIGILPDDQYLTSSLDLQCWTGIHQRIFMVLAVPMLIVWVLGLPGAALWFMRKNYERLHTKKFKDEINMTFLYNGYRLQTYWWEAAVLTRKFVLIIIVIFFATDVAMQALLAIILVVLAGIANLIFRPFELPLMNLMELLSLLSSFVTFYCGMYLFATKIDKSAQIGLSLAILLVNCAFLACAGLLWLKLFIETKQNESKIAAAVAKVEAMRAKKPPQEPSIEDLEAAGMLPGAGEEDEEEEDDKDDQQPLMSDETPSPTVDGAAPMPPKIDDKKKEQPQEEKPKLPAHLNKIWDKVDQIEEKQVKITEPKFVGRTASLRTTNSQIASELTGDAATSRNFTKYDLFFYSRFSEPVCKNISTVFWQAVLYCLFACFP